MKRIVSISFLATALLVLIALSFVTHTHHRAVMGVVPELCDADHTDNDRHTTHDTAAEHADEGGCVAHASFAPADVKTSVATPDGLLLQAVGQVAPLAVPAPAAIGLPTEYGLFIIAYKSATPNPGSGLRAPPSLS